MIVEMTPKAREYLQKKNDTNAVTIKMVMSGG